MILLNEEDDTFCRGTFGPGIVQVALIVAEVQGHLLLTGIFLLPRKIHIDETEGFSHTSPH